MKRMPPACAASILAVASALSATVDDASWRDGRGRVSRTRIRPAAATRPGASSRRCDAGRRRISVLEEQLPVLRQRPEVVGDQRLELVGDLAQRVLGRDDVVDEGARLGLHGARLVGRVLGVLERVDGVDELVGEARRPRSQTALIPRDEGAPASWPRYCAVAGRIIVRAMSRAQFASMLLTLT